LECAAEDLELRPGARVGIKGTEKEVSFQGISQYGHWIKGGPIIGTHSWVFDQPTIDPRRCSTVGNPSRAAGAFSFGAVVVDVQIDEATGKTEVLRAWSAVDAGRAINPLALEGQIQGAFVQGLGFALTEEMIWDGPRLANPSLMDYKIPTSMDVPLDLVPIIVEANHPDGPFGARGAGEVGMNVVAAAIANAVAAATGQRARVLPLTPERVLQLMTASEAGQVDRASSMQ
jgi:CO/xanthine dehydrogenase Mo-binding subunit